MLDWGSMTGSHKMDAMLKKVKKKKKPKITRSSTSLKGTPGKRSLSVVKKTSRIGKTQAAKPSGARARAAKAVAKGRAANKKRGGR